MAVTLALWGAPMLYNSMLDVNSILAPQLGGPLFALFPQYGIPYQNLFAPIAQHSWSPQPKPIEEGLVKSLADMVRKQLPPEPPFSPRFRRSLDERDPDSEVP